MDVTRRRLIVAGGAFSIAPLFPGDGLAGPDDMAAEVARVVQGRPLIADKMKLEISALAENGFSVPMTVSVESPMTASDHVKTIHVFSEKNPLTNVVRFHLGPRAGKARVSTSIRLADTQRITAIAETSTGALYSAYADVIVTLSACLETG
jgi:sulfur-oxidizing protein SoxY